MKYGSFITVQNPSIDPYAVYVKEDDGSFTLLDSCHAKTAKEAIKIIRDRYDVSTAFVLKAIRHKAKSTFTHYPQKLKNPAKYWIIDTENDYKVKSEHATLDMATRVCDRANAKIGRERYQVLGYGVDD